MAADPSGLMWEVLCHSHAFPVILLFALIALGLSILEREDAKRKEKIR